MDNLNFSMDAKSPFVVIFAILPYLADRLRLNANKSLKQRILMRYQFDFLSLEETADYLQHRLHLSCALRPMFSENAVNAITSASGGCPRLIGNLATHTLLLGCQLNLQTITDETVLIASPDAGLVF